MIRIAAAAGCNDVTLLYIFFAKIAFADSAPVPSKEFIFVALRFSSLLISMLNTAKYVVLWL